MKPDRTNTTPEGFDQLPARPHSVHKIVADGRHNAFAAFTRWQNQYWLGFRKGSGHIARDGDIFALRSDDGRRWRQALHLDVAGDDRDAQFIATPERLFLYINSLTDGRFDISVTYTDDGCRWSAPQPAYQRGFILWKPIAFGDRFFAGAHRPGPNDQRAAHLVTSTDGLNWDFVSTIRAGQGESETSLHFETSGKLTAFLRNQTRSEGDILEAQPPYKTWTQQPAGIHLSGHAVYVFDGVTYLISRILRHHPPEAAAKVDQATMVYTFKSGRFTPYCLLGPLAGNYDSSYATAVRDGDTMLVVYHRSGHEYAGPYRAADHADLYLARVPLEKTN